VRRPREACRWCWRAWLSAIGFALLTPTFVPAQDVTEPAVKATALYKFAIFTEWPSDVLGPGAPFTICAVGDNSVGDALAREVAGRTVGEHPVSVSRNSSPAGVPRGCHVLYVGGGPVANALNSISGFGGTPVLTMSDVDGFAQGGGIAQLYFEHGKLRFTINMAALKRSRLQMSAQLLQLAKRI
jgi:hypothetical protein